MVGGGGLSVSGATPTRIKACGIPDFPINRRTNSRAAVTSIMCVSVHVAKPAIVHSSNTLDNISPHPNADPRLSS